MGSFCAARDSFIERWLKGRTDSDRALADEELRLLCHWYLVALTGRWDVVGNDLPAEVFNPAAGKATPEQVAEWRKSKHGDLAVQMMDEARKAMKRSSCFTVDATTLVMVENPERFSVDKGPSFYIAKIYEGRLVSEQFV